MYNIWHGDILPLACILIHLKIHVMLPQDQSVKCYLCSNYDSKHFRSCQFPKLNLQPWGFHVFTYRLITNV